MPETARQKAGGIRTQSEKLRTLIEDLNLTSKLEYGTQPLRKQEFAAGPLFRELVAQFCESPQAESCGVSLQQTAATEQAKLCVDRALLERLLENLLADRGGRQMRAARRCETRSACMIFARSAQTISERMKREEMDAVRRALPVPQRVMAVVLSALFVLCPLAAYAAGEEADAVPLPIIMYHEVKPDKSGKDAIQPWELESDLRWLAENGYTTVVMADVIAYVRDGTPLPEKPIVLSFDDGYYNNYVYVLPLLRQYAAHIVFSLLGCNTDDFTEWPSESIDYAHVTWDQLNEMLDTGLVEVQNHSYDLHRRCLLVDIIYL